MSYGLAKGLKTVVFTDYQGAELEDNINKFLTENPNVEILDIKVQYHPNPKEYDYGGEYALIIYREGFNHNVYFPISHRDIEDAPPPPPPSCLSPTKTV